MFLLILKALTVFSTEREALHSTMFLLILSNDWFVILLFQSLHSTMFLLIRCISEWTLLWVPGFTFHNVSINTVFTGETETLKDLFTFHNVSINTDFLHKLSVSFASLHSTMFLLIQITNFHSAICTIIFTFHNVSINTAAPRLVRSPEDCFTFHNVSINTPCSTFTYNTSFILPFSVDLVIYNYFIHKIDIITLYKTSIFLINKGFVNLPGFFPYRRLTITK